MTFVIEHKFVILDIRDGLHRAHEHKACDSREEALAEIERVMKTHDGPNWEFTIVETWKLVCKR